MIKCLALNQLKMIPKNVKNHSNCASGITSHPVDDTAPLGKPLHGRGHRHMTFPGHTGSPNAVKKNEGKVQAKQSKHVKAKNEGKITQAEFDSSIARKLSCKPQSCDESANSSKNYKLVKEGQKTSVKCEGGRWRLRAAVQSSISKGTTFPSTM